MVRNTNFRQSIKKQKDAIKTTLKVLTKGHTHQNIELPDKQTTAKNTESTLSSISTYYQPGPVPRPSPVEHKLNEPTQQPGTDEQHKPDEQTTQKPGPEEPTGPVEKPTSSVQSNTSEANADEETSTKDNFDRIVFGVKIGGNYPCSTPAQAFADRLYSFEHFKEGKTGEDLEKIEAEQQEFLNNYKNELQEGESAEEMLQEAFSYSQSEIKKLNESAEKLNSDTFRTFANRFELASQTIKELLPPTQEEDCGLVQ